MAYRSSHRPELTTKTTTNSETAHVNMWNNSYQFLIIQLMDSTVYLWYNLTKRNTILGPKVSGLESTTVNSNVTLKHRSTNIQEAKSY